jgi:hypothetical protein
MPEIIARSCCSQMFRDVQPRLTVPTTRLRHPHIIEEGLRDGE